MERKGAGNLKTNYRSLKIYNEEKMQRNIDASFPQRQQEARAESSDRSPDRFPQTYPKQITQEPRPPIPTQLKDSQTERKETSKNYYEVVPKAATGLLLPAAPSSQYGLVFDIGSNQSREPKVYPKDPQDKAFKDVQISQNESIVLYVRHIDFRTKTQEIIFEDIFHRDIISGTITINYASQLPENTRQRFELFGRNPLICVQLDTKLRKSKLVIMDIKKVEEPNKYAVTYDTNRAIELSYISESDSEHELNLIAKTTDGALLFVQVSKRCLRVYLRDLSFVEEFNYGREIATLDTLTQKGYYLLAVATQDNNNPGDLFIYEFNVSEKVKISPRTPIYVNYGGNYNYRTVKILNNSQVVLIGINQEQENPAIRCISYGLSGSDKGTRK